MRKSVRDFANEMEGVLKLNDRKTGWDDLPVSYLLSRLKEEINELNVELIDRKRIGARREAIDVANFAMMIWDVLRKRK